MNKTRPNAWIVVWARDSSVMLASQVSALVVTTLLTILVARELGPDEFGILAGLFGFAWMLTILVDAGISTHLLRELSAEFAQDDGVAGHTRASERLSSALSATTAVATLLIVTSALVSVVAFRHDLVFAFALSSLIGYTAILACSDGLEVAYRAQRRLRLVGLAILIEKGTLAILVGAAVWTHAGLAAIACGYLIAGFVRLTFNVVRVRAMGLLHRQRPSLRSVAGVLRSSLPFGLSSTTPTAIVRLDTTLVALISAAAGGIYAVGDRILTVVLVLSSTAAVTLFPLLARHRDAPTATRRAAGLMFIIGIAVAAFGITVAPAVVPALFGPEFRESVRPVQLMLLATPFIYASSVMMTGLYSLGRERRVLVVMLTFTLAGTLLVFLGQIVVGVEGAAAGYALRFVGMSAGLYVASRAGSSSASSPELTPVSREERPVQGSAI